MHIVNNAHDINTYADQVAAITMNIGLALTILARTAPDDLKPFLHTLSAAAENAADKANLIQELSQ